MASPHSVMAENDSSTLAADCRAPGQGPRAPELSEPLAPPPPMPELDEVPRRLRVVPLRAFRADCDCAQQSCDSVIMGMDWKAADEAVPMLSEMRRVRVRQKRNPRQGGCVHTGNHMVGASNCAQVDQHLDPVGDCDDE